MKTGYLAALLACLVGIFSPHTAGAQELDRVVSRDEFYYFDENNQRKPLVLSRSIAVRFLASKDDREGYLRQQFSPVAIRQIRQLYQRTDFALDFLPTQNQAARAAMLRRMAADPDIDVAPIFNVDGIDAIVDGIHIETTAPMSRETIARALERYFGSGIGIHEITPERNLWHISLTRLFFLNSEKLPLHALSLANLLHTTNALVGVKRATPKFARLFTPVDASISVYPLSGTVGRERQVTLRFRIFGRSEDEVVIDELDIPDLFLPGRSMPLSNGKPPHSSFWNVIGQPEKRPRQSVGTNEWLIEHVYTVNFYAPESDWVFQLAPVAYRYRGEKRQASIPATTFFVRPHVDNKMTLQDMPFAYPMPVSAYPDPVFKETERQSAWYGTLENMIGRTAFRTSVHTVLGGSVVLVAFCALILGIRVVARRRDDLNRRATEGTRLAKLLDSADRASRSSDMRGAFSALHAALSYVLHDWDSMFPKSNVTYQHVKDIIGPSESGLHHKLENMIGLRALFDSIEERNDPSFFSTDDVELKDIYINLRNKIEKLSGVLARQRGGEV